MRYHEQASFLSIPFELHVYSFPLRAGLPFAGRDREKIFRARPSHFLVDYPPTAPDAPSRHRRPPDPPRRRYPERRQEALPERGQGLDFVQERGVLRPDGRDIELPRAENGSVAEFLTKNLIVL